MPKVKKKTKTALDRNKKIYGAILLGLILGYFFVYQPVIKWQDKRRFNKAEAAIEQIYNEIVAEIGQPNQLKRSKSCDRPNLKFAKGPLSCDVNIDFVYENKNLEQSKMLMGALSSRHSSAIRVGSGSSEGNGFISSKNVYNSQVFFQDIEGNEQPPCILSYSYPTRLNRNFSFKHGENFIVGISCGGPAKAKHYPLRD